MLALSLVVSVAVVTAAPRGLPAASSEALLAQVDARLPKWLSGGGDRKALLANEKELKELVATFPINPADVKPLLKGLKADQGLKAGQQAFTATKALVSVGGRQTTVSLFDGKGRCEVSFLEVPKEGAGRFVIVVGPLTDERTVEQLLEREKDSKQVQLFEKKPDGAWAAVAVPAPAPPDCTAKLKAAAKAVYVAEKSYFAEVDAYSDALEKVGVDVKALGVTSVKVTLKGQGPTGTFSADVAHEDGLVRVTDASGEVSVVKPCTR